jgi:antitoxin VapB
VPKSWSEFLDKLEPVDVDWPDVDEGLLPADDVDLLK